MGRSAGKKKNPSKIKLWQIALLVFTVGFAVFFTGLNNPFQNDDTYQIVNNAPVHSLSNIVTFFKASTFYNGEKLTGIYYRPLMTTTFSVIYAIFHATPAAYHVIQLLFYLSAAFLLYLIFRRFLKPLLALPLALIFLVHPLNSQVVYSIPTMQDVLFFFFGTLALWVLITYRSNKSLVWTAVFLFLAMLSKETGLLFTLIAALYLFWFDRERLRTFIGIMVISAAAYLALKINAVGVSQPQHAGPIDEAGLTARLLTIPSIIWFYMAKFIFPLKLATGYYWVNTHFSVQHVLLPLLAEIATLCLVIYIGVRIKRAGTKENYLAYRFFAAWTVIAMLPYLQIIPLDLTASESWAYFSMAGLLGMIGAALQAFNIRAKAVWVVPIIAILVSVLGIRTAIRGTDYSSQYQLALHDNRVSKNDYAALSNISQGLIEQKRYKEAAAYAQRSVDIYPVASNYVNLGVALQESGNYTGAKDAYNKALKYGNLSVIYENLSLIYLVYASPVSTAEFFQKALNEYPHDFRLWLYLAIFEGAAGSTDNAKSAIQNAALYGSVPPQIYYSIMQGQAFSLKLLGRTVLVH